MEIIQIALFIMVSLILYIAIKDKKQEIAIFIPIAAGAIVLIFLLPKISGILAFVNSLAIKANIDSFYIGIVLKIIGIAFIATFCSELCKDAGASSLASKVEFSGKILILILAIPILMAVLDSILNIM